jgi:hypothetical protein
LKNYKRRILIYFSLDRGPHPTKSAWFIGLITAIVILFIVLGIVCGLMTRKGGKYPGKY